MPLDPSAPTRAPDLVRQSTREGLWTAFMGVLALAASALLTLLGLVGPCFFLLTPFLAIAGVIALPIGLWQAADPTSHASLRGLGATRADRRRVARWIGQAVLAPETLHVQLSGRRTLSVTPEWLVVHGNALLVAPRSALLHAWPAVTIKKRRGRETGRKHKIALRFRDRTDEIEVTPAESDDVLATLGLANPAAFLGHLPELDRMSAAALAEAVEGRRAGLAGVPAPPGPPPGEFQPAASRSLVGPALLLVFVGLPALAFGLMCASCGGLIALGEYQDSFVADLAPACDHTPVPTASTAAPAPDVGVVAFDRSGDGWTPHRFLFGDGVHEGGTTAESAVVLCRDDAARTVIEQCGELDRVRWTQHVQVVRATTGEVLADEVISRDPPECGSPEADDAVLFVSGGIPDRDDATAVVVAALAAAGSAP